MMQLQSSQRLIQKLCPSEGVVSRPNRSQPRKRSATSSNISLRLNVNRQQGPFIVNAQAAKPVQAEVVDDEVVFTTAEASLTQQADDKSSRPWELFQKVARYITVGVLCLAMVSSTVQSFCLLMLSVNAITTSLLMGLSISCKYCCNRINLICFCSIFTQKFLLYKMELQRQQSWRCYTI